MDHPAGRMDGVNLSRLYCLSGYVAFACENYLVMLFAKVQVKMCSMCRHTGVQSCMSCHLQEFLSNVHGCNRQCILSTDEAVIDNSVNTIMFSNHCQVVDRFNRTCKLYKHRLFDHASSVGTNT